MYGMYDNVWHTCIPDTCGMPQGRIQDHPGRIGDVTYVFILPGRVGSNIGTKPPLKFRHTCCIARLIPKIWAARAGTGWTG